MSHADEKKRRLGLLMLWIKQSEGIALDKLVARLGVECGTNPVTANQYLNDLKVSGLIEFAHGCAFFPDKPMPKVEPAVAAAEVDDILAAKPVA